MLLFRGLLFLLPPIDRFYECKQPCLFVSSTKDYIHKIIEKWKFSLESKKISINRFKAFWIFFSLSYECHTLRRERVITHSSPPALLLTYQ